MEYVTLYNDVRVSRPWYRYIYDQPGRYRTVCGIPR